MALTGVWSTPVEHVDGELMTSAKVNAWQNNLLHLASRPDGIAVSSQTGQTATTGTLTVLTNPAVTVTPKVTGNVLLIGIISLNHSVANGGANIGFDVNGTTTNPGYAVALPTGPTLMIPFLYLYAVTANTAYTFKLAFNTFSGGTVTATNGYYASLYVIEVG